MEMYAQGDYEYNDGGRAAAGYKGATGDCVVRAIAIAADLPYQQVYDDLMKLNVEFIKGRSREAKKQARQGASPRNGTFRKVYDAYLLALGFKWTPTCSIGSSERVHLHREELLELGHYALIARCSKHMVAALDGVVQDTYDCTRDGTRMVYGYYAIPFNPAK